MYSQSALFKVIPRPRREVAICLTRSLSVEEEQAICEALIQLIREAGGDVRESFNSDTSLFELQLRRPNRWGFLRDAGTFRNAERVCALYHACMFRDVEPFPLTDLSF